MTHPWHYCLARRHREPSHHPPVPGRKGVIRRGWYLAGMTRDSASEPCTQGPSFHTPTHCPPLTEGGMSRFQRVIRVHSVLSMSELRCSPRPVMCWEGREVDSCRNWSAKNRGATVVFSLWGDAGLQAWDNGHIEPSGSHGESGKSQSRHAQGGPMSPQVRGHSGTNMRSC